MLALGCASTRELEARCTPDDIEVWRAFFAGEPTGDHRMDQRFKALIQEVRRLHPKLPDLKASEILPTPWELYEAYVERQTEEYQRREQARIATAFAGWLGVKLEEDTKWL